MLRYVALCLYIAVVGRAQTVEVCTGGAQHRLVAALQRQLRWEEYWRAPRRIDLARVHRPVDLLIFWNDQILGYCSNQLRACGVYGLDAANSSLRSAWLFSDQLDPKSSNLELEQAILKRLADGPGVVVTTMPTSGISGVPGAPHPDSWVGALARMADEANRHPPAHKVVVTSCLARGVSLQPEVPEAIKAKKVPASIDSLATWWRKQCAAQHCGNDTLTVPYYSDSDPEVVAMIEGGSGTTLYIMQRDESGVDTWTIGAHTQYLDPTVLRRIKESAALQVRLE